MLKYSSSTASATITRIVLAGAIAMSLQACNQTIDSRQTHLEQGLIYKKDASNPFSGTLNNVGAAEVAKGYATQFQLFDASCTVPVQEGLFDGLAVCKDAKGTKVAEVTYGKGKMDGAFKVWASDTSNLMMSMTVRGGMAEGVVERFNPKTGKIISSIQYDAGKKVGSEKLWDVTGETLLTDVVWENGKQTGVRRSGDREEHYSAGTYVGTWKTCRWSASLTGERLSATDTKYRVYYSLAEKLGGTSFLPAVADSPADVECTEEVYVNGVKQVKAVEQPAPNPTSTGNVCLDSKIADFHKWHGKDKIVSKDEMQEWEAFCKDKKW